MDAGSAGRRAAPGRRGRVYSIASSPAAVGDEAHLTVAVVGSDTDRRLLAGAASNFVVNTPADSNVQVWIET